jgi:hypothetical protein
MSIFFDDDKSGNPSITEPNLSAKQTKPTNNINTNMDDTSVSSSEEHVKH